MGIFKKKAIASKKEPVKQSFAPRAVQPRPFSALGCLVMDLLVLVALFDYHPQQSHWITTDAHAPDGTMVIDPNMVGEFGASMAFWLIRLLGIMELGKGLFIAGAPEAQVQRLLDWWRQSPVTNHRATGVLIVILGTVMLTGLR